MSTQRKKIFDEKVKKMVVKKVTGTVVVKKVTDDVSSISTGDKTERKVRFTGQLGIGDEYLADIESLVIKGPPDDMEQLMKALNLDNINEGTKIHIDKNLHGRLDVTQESEE